MMKKLLVALVMAVAVPVGMTAVTGVEFVPEAQAINIKKGLKKIGRGAKKVGRGVKTYGEAQVWAAKKAGKAIGRGARKVGRKAWRKPAIKQFFKDNGRFYRGAGKAIGRTAKCFGVPTSCRGRIGDPVGPKISDHRR